MPQLIKVRVSILSLKTFAPHVPRIEAEGKLPEALLVNERNPPLTYFYLSTHFMIMDESNQKIITFF